MHFKKGDKMRQNLCSIVLCLVLVIGCTGNAGGKYVGTWVDTKGGAHQITIARNDKSFLLTMNYGNFENQPLPATFDANTGLMTMNAEGMSIALPIDSTTGLLSLDGTSFKKK